METTSVKVQTANAKDDFPSLRSGLFCRLLSCDWITPLLWPNSYEFVMQQETVQWRKTDIGVIKTTR